MSCTDRGQARRVTPGGATLGGRRGLAACYERTIMTLPVRALILDFGEVLVRAQPAEAAARLASLCGARPDAFAAAYWEHRRGYDTHGSVSRYWRDVLASCAGRDLPPGPEWERLLGALVEVDVASWTLYLDDTWALAARARAAGVRTAVLSNCASEIMNRVRAERGLEQHFDAVVISCEVGVTKPDPGIYAICLERLGARPEEALFVDDRQENVAAAAALGLQTLHFTSPDLLPELSQRLFPEG